MFKKAILQNSKLGRVIRTDQQIQMLVFKNMFAYSSLLKLQSKQFMRHSTFAFSSLQQDSNYLYTLASCHFRQENYSKALEKLNELNANESSDIRQLKLLAKTYVALSEYEDGLRIFQKIVELKPGDIESNVFQMGILEKISEAPDVEIDIINDRIISNHKEDEGQQVAIALVSLLDEEFTLIPDLLQNISTFTVEENRFLGYATLKEAYIRLNQYDQGIKVLEEALQNCTSYKEEIYFELAKIAHLAQNSEKELQALENCLSINENQFDILVELGWIYYTKGQIGISQQYLQKAEQLEKSNSKRFYYQAKIYQAQNKLDDAQKLLEQCIQLDDQVLSAQVFNQMGVLYLQRKEFKKAQSYFFQALEINNEEAQYYFNIAITYNLTNELERAINYYEKGLLLQPKNISALKSKGILQSKLKRYHDAIDTFNQALEYQPDNTDVLFELAIAYKLTFDKTKVINLCNKILLINRNHTAATELLKQYNTNK